MSNSGFDAQAFYSALDAERAARGLKWKQLAKEAGVSASTLTRMGQGKRPDVDSLACLASWSGLDVSRYIMGASPKRSSAETLTEITALLRADRNLRGGGAEALEAIVKSAYSHLRKVQK